MKLELVIIGNKKLVQTLEKAYGEELSLAVGKILETDGIVIDVKGEKVHF